ncbi:Glutamyl-tRNA(Gln) amidotransferase subunit B, chloroplastic/mitochondrial [Glycine max]|nr:Glutamyl-tRNA(Gln) amidotransferase subunit B, chloroplastic/mitochondrial [Glycine max]
MELKHMSNSTCVTLRHHFDDITDLAAANMVRLHSQGQEDQIVQETCLWEEGSQARAILKELPTIILSQEYVDGIKNSLPELLEIKRRRYKHMGLSMQDVLFQANYKNLSSMLFCAD